MKKALLLSFLIFIPLFAYTKQSPIDSLKNRVTILEIKAKKSYDSLLVLNNGLLAGNAALQEKVDYNDKLLERYDKLNNIVFIVIGLLFAFFGIAIPIYGNIFIVQPAKEKNAEAQKMLDDVKVYQDNLKNNMQSIFSAYLLKNRDDIIDNILSRLKNNPHVRVVEETDRLSAYSADGFTDKQVIKIINLARTAEDGHRPHLIDLIIHTENDITTEFFRNELKNKSISSSAAIVYSAFYNKEEFIDDIIDYLLAKKQIIFPGVVQDKYFSFVMKVYNSERLINNAEDKMIITAISNNKMQLKGQNRISLEETKLYEKFLELTTKQS